MPGISLFACGSNASGQLAIGHASDVSVLSPCVIHPCTPFSSSSSSSSFALPFPTSILNLVSSSTHALLLVTFATRTETINEGSAGEMKEKKCFQNLLLGAGTNTVGQLGPRCALWDDVRAETMFKPIDLTLCLSKDGDISKDRWEPVQIAATWTTSFIVYQRRRTTTTTLSLTDQSSSCSSSSHQRQINEDRNETLVEQRLVSTGSNDFGELGKQASSSYSTSSRPSPSNPSDNPTIVDIGLRPGETVSLIRGGQRHVIAVLSGKNGQRIIGWGAARKGELDPSSSSSTSFHRNQIPASKGKGKGKATAYPIYLPPTELKLPVDLREVSIVDLALGASHTMVLLSDGRILSWGSDAKGQISGLTAEAWSDVRQIAATWGGSYILTLDKMIHSQGANTHGQLLRSTLREETGGKEGKQGEQETRITSLIHLPVELEIKRLVAGSEHVLVQGSNQKGRDELWSGGWNEHGNLGLGDQIDRPRLIKVNLDNMVQAGDGRERKIMGVWSGCAATWVAISYD